jgi:hypothetical protein
MKDTERNMYALFPQIKLIAKQKDIGNILVLYRCVVTLPSFTPGKRLVVLAST